MTRDERVQRSIEDLQGMDPKQLLGINGQVSVAAALTFLIMVKRQYGTEANELKDLFILERDDDLKPR